MKNLLVFLICIALIGAAISGYLVAYTLGRYHAALDLGRNQTATSLKSILDERAVAALRKIPGIRDEGGEEMAKSVIEEQSFFAVKKAIMDELRVDRETRMNTAKNTQASVNLKPLEVKLDKSLEEMVKLNDQAGPIITTLKLALALHENVFPSIPDPKPAPAAQ